MLQFPPTGIPVERVAEEYSGGQRVQRVKRGRGSDNQRRRLSEVFDNGQHPKNAADGERSQVPLRKYESEPKAVSNARDVADISDTERWATTHTAVQVRREPMPGEERFTGTSAESDEGDVRARLHQYRSELARLADRAVQTMGASTDSQHHHGGGRSTSNYSGNQRPIIGADHRHPDGAQHTAVDSDDADYDRWSNHRLSLDNPTA